MENSPVILITNRKTLPEYSDRWLNWLYTVYFPFLIKIPQFKGINTYRIARENHQYNPTLTTFHFDSIGDLITLRNNPEYLAWLKDINTTWTNRGESVWSVRYELIKSFTGNTSTKLFETQEVDIKNNPVIQLEAYKLSNKDEEKLLSWFYTRAYEVYIPILIRVPGLIEYSSYKLLEIPTVDFYSRTIGTSAIRAVTEVEYPKYLSILTFENIEAYEKYEKSIELIAFRDSLKTVFPEGLQFLWNVQYQLVKSWRK